MKTYTLPQTDLTVSSIILGMMRISNMSNGEIQQLVDGARDAGVTFFDHADVYGGAPHRCEARFGEAISLTAAGREKLVIQSKVGIGEGFFGFLRRAYPGLGGSVARSAEGRLSGRTSAAPS
jgi:predicted oxidoreductase